MYLCLSDDVSKIQQVVCQYPSYVNSLPEVAVHQHNTQEALEMEMEMEMVAVVVDLIVIYMLLQILYMHLVGKVQLYLNLTFKQIKTN
jgi:hypothetical protein